MTSTTTQVDTPARIPAFINALATDAGILAIQQIAAQAEQKAIGTGPATALARQLRQLAREAAQLQAAEREAKYGKPYADSDAFLARREQDAKTLRTSMEARICAFRFGPVAPLLAAITESDRQDNLIAPGLADYEGPNDEDEDDLHVPVKACNQMGYALERGQWIKSFHDLSADHLRQFGDSIEGGSFYPDGNRWARRVPARVQRMAA